MVSIRREALLLFCSCLQILLDGTPDEIQIKHKWAGKIRRWVIWQVQTRHWNMKLHCGKPSFGGPMVGTVVAKFDRLYRVFNSTTLISPCLHRPVAIQTLCVAYLDYNDLLDTVIVIRCRLQPIECLGTNMWFCFLICYLDNNIGPLVP